MEHKTLPIKDYEKQYKFLKSVLVGRDRQLMAIDGYYSEGLSKSPFAYYVATWPGTDVSIPAITSMQMFHRELAGRSKLPPSDLRYDFYAKEASREYSYPYLDEQGMNLYVLPVLQQHPQFWRVDGLFFTFSADLGSAMTVGFCSFFKGLEEFIYKMYAISSPDPATAPGRNTFEEILENIFQRSEFQNWQDAPKLKEKVYGNKP